MSFTPDLIAELKVLALFNLDSSQEGIKVHNTATQDVIAAAKRLYEKKLTDQPDGGYLTSLGHDAAEHAQQLLTILQVGEPA
ncbi:TIGR02647 family protein [Pseudomonas sp. SDI]|uniref:TIGR02647 family protein n=1 Tax=Pseudomonas sp. SDI TaxID=2170734 RepID=UPI000DE6E13F|nr:TIGR02647 family protein [Pseudomonas sp. SDI]PWB32698.1 TIGR02647 family protein [Pseudomonas sp. SDI]